MQSEKISTPIYVECDKMYQSKVCVQEFSYFVSGLDIQDEKSEYNSPVHQKNQLQVAKYDNLYTIFFKEQSYTPKNQLQVAKYDQSYIVFFKDLIRTYSLVVKVSRRESGDMGLILDEC